MVQMSLNKCLPLKGGAVKMEFELLPLCVMQPNALLIALSGVGIFRVIGGYFG